MRSLSWMLAVGLVVFIGMQSGPGLSDADSQALGGLADCNVDGTAWYDCNVWNNDPDCTGGNLTGAQHTGVPDDLYQFIVSPNSQCTDPDCKFTDHLYGFTSLCNDES